MESVGLEFGWLPLSDSLAKPDCSLREEATEATPSEIKRKWKTVEPRGSMTSPKYQRLQASSGETFQFSMPNVLRIDDSNPTNNKSLEYPDVDSDVQEQLLCDSLSSVELFPWPAKGPKATPDDLLIKDSQKALFLALQLNEFASVARVYENGNAVLLKYDVYIHVFLNGSICSSRMVPFDVLEKIKSGFHEEMFHGLKIGCCMEKAWIIGEDAKATHRNEKEDVILESDSAARWKAINQKLVDGVSSNSNASSALQYLSTYVSAIANLPVPHEGLPESNTTYAVVDVILVGGLSRKNSEKQRHAGQVQADFTAACEKNSKDQMVLQDAVHSSDDEMSIVVETIENETDGNISSNQSGANDLQHSNNHTEPPSEAERSNVVPLRPIGFDDLYDDSDDFPKIQPESISRSQASPGWSDVERNIQQLRSTYLGTSPAPEAQQVDESDRESHNSPIRARLTGHISNIAALRSREQRPAGEIAQFVQSKRKRGGRRRRIVTSDTSVASLHGSSDTSSLDSGPTNSVVWPSTSSEIQRQRQAKSDLSLPRKKRRRLRYRSVDFDSEDPVATIPDALESKIRIVPRNEKPLLPLQETHEHELHGPSSRLVRPMIHRNLRKKRERQFVKRNAEVGLTERDVYNWIKADYDARDGQKPWLEGQDHEHIPLAQPLGELADQMSIADSDAQYESVWDKFMNEARKEADEKEELMKGSVVAVSSDVIRSCPDDEEVDFKSERILLGVRFIFA